MDNEAILAELKALREDVALLLRAFYEDRMSRPVQQMTQARMMQQARTEQAGGLYMDKGDNIGWGVYPRDDK